MFIKQGAQVNISTRSLSLWPARDVHPWDSATKTQEDKNEGVSDLSEEDVGRSQAGRNLTLPLVQGKQDSCVHQLRQPRVVVFERYRS